MKTKSKALLLTLCAVLLVAASVMGTMAYLTSNEEVVNTFTVGSVNIKLDEAKVDDDGKAVAGADRVKANEYKLLPGLTYTKDPTVTVLKGSEESYVRMKVTFNNASALIAMCTNPEWGEDAPTEIQNAWPLLYMVNFTEESAKWDGITLDNMMDAEKMLADAKYFDAANDTLTYYFYYIETVGAPNGDVVLPVLFDGIKVPNWVTGNQLAELNNFKITAVAEAIQADGFANADAAWAAYDAQ